MSIRPVIETRRAQPAIEGAGVHLHRAFGFQDPTEADPFLLFDDFRGQGVPEGQKSLAIEVTLQPQDKSYAEADLKAIADKVTAAAAKLGAALRS